MPTNAITSTQPIVNLGPVSAVIPSHFEATPTWAEATAAWDPEIDGQGNEGLANALDRLTAERAAEVAR